MLTLVSGGSFETCCGWAMQAKSVAGGLDSLVGPTRNGFGCCGWASLGT
jgi:hypothetical protein